MINRIRRVLAVLGLVAGGLLVAPAPAPAESIAEPVPEVDVTVFGGTVLVMWPDMEAVGADYFGFVLDDFHGEFRTIDWVATNQLEFQLPEDEDFQLRVIGYYHGRGWSEWGQAIRISPRLPNAPPWRVRLSAGDGSAELSWVDTGADEYRYHLWSDGGDDHRYLWTDDLTAQLPDLVNGVTYHVSMMARYGYRYTDWTTPISVTPNPGVTVQLAERGPLDYDFPEPGNADVIAVLTTAEDPARRVDDVAITAISAGRLLDSASSWRDITSELPDPDTELWVSDALTVGETFTDTVTVASSDGIVVASLLQTFMSGRPPDVDLTIPEDGGSPGRRGVFR